jgi:hypothetical protein
VRGDADSGAEHPDELGAGAWRRLRHSRCDGPAGGWDLAWLLNMAGWTGGRRFDAIFPRIPVTHIGDCAIREARVAGHFRRIMRLSGNTRREATECEIEAHRVTFEACSAMSY